MCFTFRFTCWLVLSAVGVIQTRSQDYAKAAALEKNATWEIGVTFTPEVDTNSVPNPDNYVLPVGQITDLRFVPQDGSVVLTTDGLTPQTVYSLQITNLVGTNGATLPPLTLSFNTRAMSWAQIGANELGFSSDAVSAGPDGFDLISGGIQFWERYDESTFAYEQITGDFDKRIRVAFQDDTSAYARAGLMAREVLDEGKSRPTDPFDPAQAFSRYVQVHVNPPKTADGQDGNNAYEVLVRSFPGGIGSPDLPTESLALADNVSPAYPNAWVRLKRSGQTFSFYRGNDGTNWVLLATYGFPALDENGQPGTNFANTVYVGPNYSPENGNIPFDTNLRRAFLAQFRDYGDASGSSTGEPPTLQIVKAGEEVELSWSSGTLQSTPAIFPASWTDLPAAKSPYRVKPSGIMFFRVKG